MIDIKNITFALVIYITDAKIIIVGFYLPKLTFE